MLNLAGQNIFYVQLYIKSAFTYNPGSTGKNTIKRKKRKKSHLFHNTTAHKLIAMFTIKYEHQQCR